MDVKLAPAVAAAIHRAVDIGDTGYPCGTGFAEAVSEFASRRWQWDDLEVGRTAIVPDVMLGVVEMLRLVTERGDAVIVNSPVYPPFYAFVTHDGRRVIEAPLGPRWPDRSGRVGGNVFAGTHGSRAGGGSGRTCCAIRTIRRDKCQALRRTQRCRRTGPPPRGPGGVGRNSRPAGPVRGAVRPYLSVPGAEDALALTSATKAWNLCGVKAALAIAGREAAADLRRMPEEVSHGPSHLGAIAHTAALRSTDEWLDALLQGLDGDRTLLGELVAELLPGVKYQQPQGTYLAWLDCRDLGFGEEAAEGPAVVSDLSGPARFFLDHARVALTSGHAFGTGGGGHVRVNFATSQAILTEALSRMGQALQRRGPGC